MASEEETSGHICNICGLAPGEIFDSALGPTSYARCETCREEGAESLGVICLRVRLQGGPAKVEQADLDDWWPWRVKSFADGRYIGWSEIRGRYPDFARQFGWQ